MSAVLAESSPRQGIMGRIQQAERAAAAEAEKGRHPRLIPPGLKRDTVILRAREAAREYHEAMMAGDRVGARRAAQRINSCVSYINGGTSFSSRVPLEGETQSAHDIVMAGIKTNCVDDPRWGDEATIEVRTPKGRAIAEVRFFGIGELSVEWHVIDTARPFISETGFRSDLTAVAGTPNHPGESLRAYLARRLEELYHDAEAEHRMVDLDKLAELHPEAERALASQEPAPAVEDEHGQMLMF